MANKNTSHQTLPVLPLRDIVVFPGMIVPLFVGRERSVKALEHVVNNGNEIALVAQKEASNNNPKISDIYKIGVKASVLQLLKLPDGTVKVLIEGEQRVEILDYTNKQEYFEAEVKPIQEDDISVDDDEAFARTIISQFEQYIKLNKKIPPEVLGTLQQIKSLSRLIDSAIAHINIKLSNKQKLLETLDIKERMEELYSMIEAEIGVLNTEKQIRSRVKRQMEKTQREYYLNEQLKAIQKELGDNSEVQDEVQEIEGKIEKLKMSKEARTKAKAELKKLKNMSPMSAEASVIRNYLDWLVSIPWKKYNRIKHDLNQAHEILDQEHYGLDKVKERILEFIAVQQRVDKLKGPILCLVGPPGVGKTSLAKSIASATGREFVRISLGGVRDEAEIRGHRRTYIGSMPGKIIQGMKKTKSSNPLILLDEIDKMGSDFRGDPASALLEVLDPEQNNAFNDHYLEIDYDLSDVLFLTTANSLNMPRPLMDRLEVIRLSGYTENEKLEIARHHLLPRQYKEHGLRDGEIKISDNALLDLIRYYTKEAGVRNLDRELAKLSRKSLKEILQSDSKAAKKSNNAKTSKKKADKKINIGVNNLEKYAGVKKYDISIAEQEPQIGVTQGLAYTEVGGEILQIEAVAIPGNGKITITGKLGDVMQESIQAAASYVRSRSLQFGITPPEFKKKDIHVHVPEGAIPKDGPSAGVAMCTTIVSLLSGVPVRSDIAMTGEITLRGRVLTIGGLKEKLLAALRGGVKTVLIPEGNRKDIIELPDNIKRHLEIIPVSNADEVLRIALTEELQPVEWQESEEDKSLLAIASEDQEHNNNGEIIRH